MGGISFGLVNIWAGGLPTHSTSVALVRLCKSPRINVFQGSCPGFSAVGDKLASVCGLPPVSIFVPRGVEAKRCCPFGHPYLMTFFPKGLTTRNLEILKNTQMILVFVSRISCGNCQKRWCSGGAPNVHLFNCASDLFAQLHKWDTTKSLEASLFGAGKSTQCTIIFLPWCWTPFRRASALEWDCYF